MPRPEWGVKRTCPHCETRFYDLQNEPIVCPECGTTYDVDHYGKVSATRERRAAVPVGAGDEDLVEDEDLVADTEAEEEDEPLLEDEDEDADDTGPALSDEEEDADETASFKGAALIDEDEEDETDEDVDLDEDEEDEDIDLDDVDDADDKH